MPRTSTLTLAMVLAAVAVANAQQTVWHLHGEPDGSSPYKLLKTAGPDTAATVIQRNLAKINVNSAIEFASFRSQLGAPSVGTIPAGSVVTFSVWMRKTAAQGVFHPMAAVFRSSGTITSPPPTSSAALAATTAHHPR